MSDKVEAPVYRFDALKWLLVVVIVAAGVVANSYFASDVSLLYRVLGIVAAGAVALFVAASTAKGYALINVLREAQVEVRKVVWPTRQEVNQTTLIVVAVVFVMSLILWGLDSLLGWLVSLVIG